MSQIYDYYVEPCQLCISRKGSTYESCGWCHDSDTHFKKTDGTYPGDWVSIPYGGDGYPFHEIPHATRKYYKSGNYLEFSDGKLPTDVSQSDIRTAHARNSAMKDLYEELSSGNVTSMFSSDSSKSNIDDFVNRYHSIAVEELRFEGDSGLPTGKFDQYTLGISLSGLSEKFVETAKESLQKLEDEFGDRLNETIDVAQVVEQIPELRSLFIGQELVAHEHFHLFQTLTTPVSCKLYEASREIAYLRFMAFLSYVKNGGKYDLNSPRCSVLQYAQGMPDCDERDNLLSLFDTYRGNIDVIDNFFNFGQPETVQIVDIFEGAAYTFQKLFNRTTEVETFKISSGSRYSKAADFFAKSGGTEDILLLIICHISLKFGMLDDGDFMEVMPTPQDIFVDLCLSAEKLEEELNFEKFRFAPFVPKPASEYLKERGVEFSSSHKAFLDSLQSDHAQMAALANAAYVFDMAEGLVGGYFEKRSVRFSIPQVSSSDNRFSAARGFLIDEYPLLDDRLLFLAMLVVPSFGQKFVHINLKKCLETSYEGLLGQELSAKQEDQLYSIMNDFDELLRRPTVYCCEAHPSAGYSTMKNCPNSSLHYRAKSVLGLDLNSIVE